MDVGKIIEGSGGIRQIQPGRPEPKRADREPEGGARADRVEISDGGQAVSRAPEAVRRMLEQAENVEPARLKQIQLRLEEGFYDRPEIRDQLADRLGAMLGLPISVS